MIFWLFQADEDLDPEDVELDENYTLETRSKCECLIHTASIIDPYS